MVEKYFLVFRTGALTPVLIFSDVGYDGNKNDDKESYVAIEPDNTNYIEELKKDKSSDPKKPVDCSRWEK